MLAGKKSYIVGFLIGLYGFGIQFGLWPHIPAVDYLLGGAGVMALRAGIAKGAQTMLMMLLMSFALVGCGTARLQQGGAYAPATTNVVNGVTNVVATAAPDLAFYRVDSTFDLAYSAVDAAFKFEADNRQFLWTLTPQIKKTLDEIRPQAWLAVKAYTAAREAYMANPTPAGLDSLNQALGRMQQLNAAAQAALTQIPQAH